MAFLFPYVWWSVRHLITLRGTLTDGYTRRRPAGARTSPTRTGMSHEMRSVNWVDLAMTGTPLSLL
ncbi:hypothetical protein BIV24_22205 [Streptomyces colonosanans]|uniref:Uncharacterized protein n=1 Tax=Streptomyces colonosanans TaxID=1428652 RepID=A0A1S2P5E5_9ACTN|nr:hypothetical protein BIV24_22205 [Streptomyces colonosanans]